MKSAACTKHRPHIGKLPFQQETQGSHTIEHRPHTHHIAQFFFRQILIQHYKIVAEIEKSLMGILLLQGGAPHMVDGALGYTNQHPPAGTKPPTQVDLFHVGKNVRPVRRHPDSPSGV